MKFVYHQLNEKKNDVGSYYEIKPTENFGKIFSYYYILLLRIVGFEKYFWPSLTQVF